MKISIPRTLIILLILISKFTLYSQEAPSPYSGSIIAGTDRNFIISIYQQEPLNVKILSIEDDMIVIKRRDGNTQKIKRNTITKIEEIPFGTIGSAGVGFGVPYGILGINLEIKALPFLSISGGLGTTIFSGVGYSVGARGYFRKPGPVWRPRVSAFYGINGMYAEDFNHPANRKYAGFTAGVGQIFLWQKHGFDLDLMYIINSELYDVHPGSYVRIKINVGYRYAF